MSSNSPRVIKYGNDPFSEIRCPESNVILKITYWDLWIAIILANTFNNDWDKMIDHLYLKAKSSSFLRDKFEAILNHAHLLRQALSEAGLSAGDILKKADTQFLKKQEPKARKKILGMNFDSREASIWMIDTPRKILTERAMRGHWSSFQVNPDEYAGSLERLFKSSGFYSEDQSFALEEKLSGFVDKREARASHDELFALYRAFLTVVIEKNEMIDDSYGVIGDLYGEIFKNYCMLDRTKLDMPMSEFFSDLIALLIWEDYGFTDSYKPDFFAALASSEIPLVEASLQEQRDELLEFKLEYQAENALTMFGMLYTQKQMFDKFISAAREMGTRHWSRITTMSEMAEKHQKYDLALAVYEACLGPGSHENFLKKKYEELKNRLGSKK